MISELSRRRPNWLDQWRLLFAVLVLFSHSFELTQGRDTLSSRPFGICTWGEISVCGFFVISGYLISRSWLSNPDPGAYLRNRVLRIVPAYLVAFAVSVLVVGAIGAADAFGYWRAIDWRVIAKSVITLDQPVTPPTFVGSVDPQVNGAMWTIQYEFACYLIAPLALFRRSTLIPLWLLAALVTALTPSEFARFLLMFLSGAGFYVFGLRARRWPMALCALALPALMAFPATWELGLGTAGAYLLLSLGLRERPAMLLPDISYGVYLYGSPTLKLLIVAGLTFEPALFLATLVICLLCGLASWYGVERLALRWKRGVERRDQDPAVSVIDASAEPDLIN